MFIILRRFLIFSRFIGVRYRCTCDRCTPLVPTVNGSGVVVVGQALLVCMYMVWHKNIINDRARPAMDSFIMNHIYTYLSLSIDEDR